MRNASRFIAALLLFLCLNFIAGLWFVNYKRFSVRENVGIEEYLNWGHEADVVILGSSVAIRPFRLVNSEDPNEPSASARVRWLEERLRYRGRPATVFNLAVLGQLFSDDFYTMDAYLSGVHRPNMLLLFVTPRDCYDRSFPRPADGRIFRTSEMDSFARYESIYLPTWQDKVEFVCSRLIFFYGRRGRLQIAWLDWITSTLGSAVTVQTKNASGNDFDEHWYLGVQEWKRRLEGSTEQKCNVQLKFLDLLGKDCQARHVELVIINVPRVKSVLDPLLPPHFAEYFDAYVKAIALKYHAGYIDLTSSGFDRSDFDDPVHLNKQGSEKLADTVLTELRKRLPQ